MTVCASACLFIGVSSSDVRSGNCEIVVISLPLA